MILGGEDFGKWLGHEGGAPINGIQETKNRISSIHLQVISSSFDASADNLRRIKVACFGSGICQVPQA